MSITISGLIATTPRHIVTQDGLPITSFRLAENVDGGITNWFTIVCYRKLAVNVANSLSKGERIILTGDLGIRNWDNGEASGTSAEINATSIGHDLAWGESTFTRTVLVQESAQATEPTAESLSALREQVTATRTTPSEPHSCNCRSCEVSN